MTFRGVIGWLEGRQRASPQPHAFPSSPKARPPDPVSINRSDRTTNPRPQSPLAVAPSTYLESDYGQDVTSPIVRSLTSAREPLQDFIEKSQDDVRFAKKSPV